MSNGVVTGTNVPGATLIPNAFGLAGYNEHTWTGSWGSVSYWNAFVAALEMHGVGRFFDPRLNDPVKFPIAAANGFGDLPHIPPDQGRYKTINLAAVFIRENAVFMNPANRGRFFHDGRFATLLDVVNHYNTRFSLSLTEQEKSDLVEFLKSLH